MSSYKKIFENIAELSVKMRILQTRLGGEDDLDKLNERQLLMLEMLYIAKQMTVLEFCRHFHQVRQSTISTDIKYFIGKGWVTKSFSEKDQRVHLVSITEDGEEKVEDIRKKRIEAYLPLRHIIESREEFELISKLSKRAVKAIEDELSTCGQKCK